MSVNSSFVVRKVDISDATSLSEIFTEFVGEESDVKLIKKQIEHISQDSSYYVAVACDEEKVIGTAMGIVCLDLVGNCNPFLLVENVVVKSEFRGYGVGKLLMHSIEDFARKNNCNYVILVSGSIRTEAHKFYEALGYEKQAGFKKRLKAQV